MLGVLTFLKHAAREVLDDIQQERVTLKSLPRKDVLVLLSYVDVRDGTK